MPCKPLYRSTHTLYSHNFALEGAIFALEAPYLLFALLLMTEAQERISSLSRDHVRALFISTTIVRVRSVTFWAK